MAEARKTGKYRERFRKYNNKRKLFKLTFDEKEGKSCAEIEEMDYSQVAPPSSSSGEQNSAFADALARAKQIAAKIGGGTSDLKRSFDGVGDGGPNPKKMAAINDPIGAQLKAIADQQRAQQTHHAVQAAANAAAQINAKLGINSQGGPPTSVPSAPPSGQAFGNGGMNNMANAGGMGGGMVATDNFSVPDRMVGLVIGKGGENIAMIQSETGVKVQFAQDSGGMADRPCTLTGSQQGINKAKEMINKIIQKGSGLPDGGGVVEGVVMEEVMIPGCKVGLVIGKGGENIKMLQERANVKMVMIQDSNMPSQQDKPLRITGEPARVAQAKEMVFDLLAEKESQAAGYGSGRNEVMVPRSLVGVIIGKGGEMIKKITQDTGARVQLKPDDGQDRICQVTGSPDQVEAATQFIHSLLESANQRQQGGGGGGPGPRGRGRGGPMDRGGPGDRGPRPGGRDGGGYGHKEERTFVVPADKTGLVIGKGGETVKEINRITGCWVELSRDRQPNQHDRVFHLTGQPDQIQRAIQMICEKAGLPPPNNGGPHGGPGGFGGPGGPGGPGGFNQGMQGGFHHQPGPPQHQGGPPQGWGNSFNQWNNPQQPNTPPQSDPNKQAADANAAAWAAYYQNYYNQQQPQQQQAQQQQPYQQQQQAATPAPSINPVTGQPDYSLAWAEYYRAQGMHAHAEAILQQAQQGGGGGAGGHQQQH